MASEIPFGMRFGHAPRTRSPLGEIRAQGGRYRAETQQWGFPGGKGVKDTSLAFTGTNIKGISADDKAGKDE